MPLNFEKPPPDPTLGRARTKEEMKQRRIKVKRKDVKAGLVQQGGFGTAGSEEEQTRATQYRDLIARQTESARAQFGELPKGWSYATVAEIDATAASGGSSQNIHITNRKPTITLARNDATLAVEVTLRAGDCYSRLQATDEELSSDHGLQNFVYAINHHIRELARTVIFSWTTTPSTNITVVDHEHGGPIYEMKTSNNTKEKNPTWTQSFEFQVDPKAIEELKSYLNVTKEM